MEDVSEEDTRQFESVADKIHYWKKRAKLAEVKNESQEQSKPFNVPKRWNFKFRQAKKKFNSDKVLAFFLNKKGEIEPPQWVPVNNGNIIVYKNKAYEYDPTALLRLKIKGYPIVYFMREIDRKPISNNDYSDIKDTIRSTDKDEILLKMLLQARIAQVAKKMNTGILVILGLLLVGGLIYFLAS